MIKSSPLFEPRKHPHGIDYHNTVRDVFPPEEWVEALLSIPNAKTVEQQRTTLGGVILATAAQLGKPLEGRAHSRSIVTIDTPLHLSARFQHYANTAQSPLLRFLRIESPNGASLGLGYPTANPDRYINPYAVVESTFLGHEARTTIYAANRELTPELKQLGEFAYIALATRLQAWRPDFDVVEKVAAARNAERV